MASFDKSNDDHDTPLCPPVPGSSKTGDFREHGYTIYHDILPPQSIENIRSSLHSALMALCGFDAGAELSTARCLSSLSSTGGAGAVLDVFFQAFQFEVLQDERIFGAWMEVFDASFNAPLEVGGDGVAVGDDADGGRSDGRGVFRQHPFLDELMANRARGRPQGAFIYCDRVGYRLPDELSFLTTSDFDSKNKNLGKKKPKPIRRGLTPHLDCCPHKMFSHFESPSPSNPRKWRPIQGLLALTDTLFKNEGGFECVPGFHNEFNDWVSRRGAISSTGESTEAPCKGEYTPLRPGPLEESDKSNDASVLRRVEHIPLRKGDLLFWDNRLPHANAFKNLKGTSREVIYVSFLPDVEVNRKFALEQLRRFALSERPSDMWVEGESRVVENAMKVDDLNELGRKLMFVDEW